MNLCIKSIITVFWILLSACSTREYQIVETSNPPYKPNVLFETFENLSSPKFGDLITKYRPDTVLSGETDEFRRILLLRHWISSVVPIKLSAKSYPGEGNVEQMLDLALKGQGYHCGHFMRIENAVMSAFGYVTRTLGVGPGVLEARFSHHGSNEIWSNQFNKWFMSDAIFDHHFEKDGIPLSALEIRDEYLKNKAADIVMVEGPDRLPADYDEGMDMFKTEIAACYTWITWDAFNDIFTSWPDHRQILIMVDDDHHRSNTWIRGDKPHWIYSHPEFLRLAKDKEEIYFTPNTISSKIKIDGNVANIHLESYTPNLREYQMKQLPGDEWTRVEPEPEIHLKKQKNELVFRTVNLAGVSGPEHKVIIDRK